MKLYKAIKYDGVSDKIMSSRLLTNNKNIFDWEALLCEAVTHVSHGDRKKDGDCWISATYDFQTAYNYLYNDKYNFNGIAVLDLPKTFETGYIYDYSLREMGFIDKDLANHKLISCTNDDGILVTLDMSSEFTTYYLASCLWLKGNINSLGNFRAYRNAYKYDEVLILGEGIPFTFIHKDDVNRIQFDSCIPENYHYRLFELICRNTANSEQVKKLFPESQFFYYSEEDELADYIEFQKNIVREIAIDSDSYFFGDDDLLFDEKEIRNDFLKKRKLENYNDLMKFYKNIKQKYFSKNEENRFKRFYELSYADKDTIEFERYEIVKEYENVAIIYFLSAYVYAGIYMNFKDRSSERCKLWKIINQMSDNKFISSTVNMDDFIRDYKTGQGIYRNWRKGEQTDYTQLSKDIFDL